ncbi:FliM/FliN family flagellar motor switch protein [Mariprofundus sp. KV]|uniref:flagellar motor switch protein FliM n=1 Tax=Mariprofundus sp. KV TaxID=2608715 RepID=UPI0015A4286D|nr:FliM/FliN family flagellar motor switch protein [Mariprofundus sp. KV]NWF36536.1 flagellar motor switch protein FliM [Mariprofundus sp. KV]
MSEPILAPEEIEALMAEVGPSEHADAIFAALPPIKQPEKVDKFLFAGSDEDSPERYPMFVNLQERLTEMLDEQWKELFRRDISVHVQELASSVYKDLITTDTPQVYFVFEVEGNGRMMVTFDTAMIVAFVDAMLGGDGESSENPQTLSPVELRLSRRIAEKIGNTLSNLWKPVQPLTFEVYKLDYDPQFLAVTSAMEKCFSTLFDVKISESQTGKLGVHYPRPFLEPMLESLRVTVSDEPSETDTEWTDALMDRLSSTPASLRFELDRCQINIGTFLALKPGDFLPIKTKANDPCKLWIEDIPIFKARPGESDGVLAAELIEPIHSGGKS